MASEHERVVIFHSNQHKKKVFFECNVCNVVFKTDKRFDDHAKGVSGRENTR